MGFASVFGIWWAIGGPTETDVYFHLAIARDYVADPLSYSAQIAEGPLAKYSADRAPLFHLALSLLVRLGVSALAPCMILPAIAAGALASIFYDYSRSALVVVSGLFATHTFLFRLAMCRPHSFAIAFVAIGTAFLLRGQHRRAALVNFVYTLSYSVPVLLIVGALAQGLVCRRARGVLWVAAASVVGILLHPHFPDNVELLRYVGLSVVYNALSGNPSHVPIPNELLPWSLGEFLVDSWFPLILFGIGIVRRTTPRWFWMFQISLLLLTLRSMRFIEYWAPLACLTSGPTLAYLLKDLQRLKLRWVTIALFIVAVPLRAEYAVIARGREISRERIIFRDAALWLGDHAAGEYVFNSQWDSYPELRYFGGTFLIAQGQDPALIAAHDARREEQLRAAIRGEMSSDEFRRAFPARFIVARKGSPIVGFGRQSGIVKRYCDSEVVVLEILSANRGANRRVLRN